MPPRPPAGIPPTHIQFPEFLHGELDAASLRVLGKDLTERAEIQELRAKGALRRISRPFGTEVLEAFEALLAGEIRGVQVAYRLEGHAWIDTVLATPDGCRVVRMGGPPSEEP